MHGGLLRLTGPLRVVIEKINDKRRRTEPRIRSIRPNMVLRTYVILALDLPLTFDVGDHIRTSCA